MHPTDVVLYSPCALLLKSGQVITGLSAAAQGSHACLSHNYAPPPSMLLPVQWAALDSINPKFNAMHLNAT